jgi:DNA-binding Xre family transcriptional regulator
MAKSGNKVIPGLASAIAKKGIRPVFLAEKIGIPYYRLWKVVSGKNKLINPEILRKLSVELDCSVDELLTPPQTSTFEHRDELKGDA